MRLNIGFAIVVILTTWGLRASAQNVPPTQTVNPPSSLDAGYENPLRGYYEWYGKELVPQPHLSTESYDRLSWAQLEKSEGVYDFSAIDSALATLAPGCRYAFGVMALNSCCSRYGGVDVPQYIVDHLQKGFFIPAPANSRHNQTLYIPDWNDPYFLDRVDKLFQALGRKYDGDPRIAWVDIRMYGNWGEWHLYVNGPIPYGDLTINKNGAEPGTFASKQRIIDAQVNASPHTRLLMMTDDKQALVYALHLNTLIPIGMRRDSWGSLHFAKDLLSSSMSSDDQDLVLNRWKTAPFIVESFGGDRVFEAGLDGIVQQVKDYHVSALGNYNFSVNRWDQLSVDQQQALVRAGDAAGYNIQVQQMKLPEFIHRGQKFDILANWLNTGDAPPYEDWHVVYSLVGNDGSVKWKATSGLNLATLLPGPMSQSDQFSLPADLTPGTYSLAAEVIDPKGYRPPMRLATTTPETSNGYVLGTVEVKE